MKVTRFLPDDDLIIVDGRVWGSGHRMNRPLRLVVDTGAAETIIVPEILDELGLTHATASPSRQCARRLASNRAI